MTSSKSIDSSIHAASSEHASSHTSVSSFLPLASGSTAYVSRASLMTRPGIMAPAVEPSDELCETASVVSCDAPVIAHATTHSSTSSLDSPLSLLLAPPAPRSKSRHSLLSIAADSSILHSHILQNIKLQYVKGHTVFPKRRDEKITVKPKKKSKSSKDKEKLLPLVSSRVLSHLHSSSAHDSSLDVEVCSYALARHLLDWCERFDMDHVRCCERERKKRKRATGCATDDDTDDEIDIQLMREEAQAAQQQQAQANNAIMKSNTGQHNKKIKIGSDHDDDDDEIKASKEISDSESDDDSDCSSYASDDDADDGAAADDDHDDDDDDDDDLPCAKRVAASSSSSSSSSSFYSSMARNDSSSSLSTALSSFDETSPVSMAHDDDASLPCIDSAHNQEEEALKAANTSFLNTSPRASPSFYSSTCMDRSSSISHGLKVSASSLFDSASFDTLLLPSPSSSSFAHYKGNDELHYMEPLEI